MRLIPVVLSALSGTAIAATWTDNALQQVLGFEQSKPRQPNFIFVITDDQDLELDSVKYTPLIQERLQGKGTFFKNHFVTTALCCPSRVSLWTGQQAHNTNVTDVSPPYGM
jgi:arylsulfatase A-like enzyme